MSRISLKRFTARASAGACAALAVAFLAISISGLWDDARPADVCVVLGNTVGPDGRPSERLRARLDKAVEIYRAGMFPDAIVSGGVGEEGFDEAAVMKRYLVEHGLPEDRVHADSRGLDTFETARNASAVMDARVEERAGSEPVLSRTAVPAGAAQGGGQRDLLRPRRLL